MNDKYSGRLTDGFDLKLNIFYDRSKLVAIAESDRLPVLSIVLCGNALSFFYNVTTPSVIDFEHGLSLIRDRFVTPESTRAWCLTVYSNAEKSGSAGHRGFADYALAI